MNKTQLIEFLQQYPDVLGEAFQLYQQAKRTAEQLRAHLNEQYDWSTGLRNGSKTEEYTQIEQQLAESEKCMDDDKTKLTGLLAWFEANKVIASLFPVAANEEEIVSL